MPTTFPAHSEVSLWLVGTIVFLALCLGREIGHWLRRRRQQDGKVASKTDDGFTMTSVLGLLALLMGFTFSLSMQRYDQRRELVVKEANAIGTAWVWIQMLDADQRSALSAEFRRYVDTRVRFGLANTPSEESRLYRETEQRQQYVWDSLRNSIAPIRNTPIGVSLVNALDTAMDLATDRMAGREARIPQRVLWLMLVYAMISAAMVGYEKGRYRSGTSMFFILLTLATVLILDLDRPRSGAVQVSQQAMLDVQRTVGNP
jgi:hypothetical protein